MAILKLAAEQRQEIGTRASRALRASGFIPGNLYSHGNTPTALKLASLAWTKALADELHLVMLDIPGLKPQVATIREIQRDPLSQEIVHVDLLHVEMDEAVRFQVRVEFKGVPVGVKDGGVTQVLTSHIEVECLPTNVPGNFSLDISELKVGDSLHARELTMPEGVRMVTEPDVTLVSLALVRQAVVEEVAAPVEGEEVAEGEEKEEAESEEKPTDRPDRPDRPDRRQ
jgi:large subunit ribosomal protein L25